MPSVVTTLGGPGSGSAQWTGPLSLVLAASCVQVSSPPKQCSTARRPPCLTVRWALPEADSSHAEAACHEIEAVAIAGESGAARSSHSKAPGRAVQQEVTDVQPGLTYEVSSHSSLASLEGQHSQKVILPSAKLDVRRFVLPLLDSSIPYGSACHFD